MALPPVCIDEAGKKPLRVPPLTRIPALPPLLKPGPRAVKAPVPVPDSPVLFERINFGAAPVDSVTMEQACAWLLKRLSTRATDPDSAPPPALIMGPNAFLVTLAQRNAAFANALAESAICLPDGMSVVWASRLLGARIPERVPGGEFMERMCALAAGCGKSVYLLGGLPGAAATAAAVLQARYPGLIIAGTDCPPAGFEQDNERNAEVLQRIEAARPDLLCVALGAPKQEIWMLEHCRSLSIGAALSVGAALDTTAGLRKRAPAWTHGIGVEWLYRLVMEPRRLWRRYLIGNAQFAGIVLAECYYRRRQHATARLLEQPTFVPPAGKPASPGGVMVEITRRGSLTEQG